MLTVLLLVSFCGLYQCIPVDDPSQWPGHLERFGSQQKTTYIDEIYEWPSPLDFFQNYVDKIHPVLIKGVYKYSKARYWDNEKLRGDMKSNEYVLVEKTLKENRSNIPGPFTLDDFINGYQKRPLLLFSSVMSHLKKEVELPSPLKCNETKEFLVNPNLVISQGGSRSTVYSDDVETLYCSFQGHVDTLLIEYTKNKNYVIDRPQGGYSTLDVDRVDYTKYPALRNVDVYFKTTINEGDCLYIPYKWYKQQNSFANREGRSIAMNMWFNHVHDHKPKDCSILDKHATLDKYQYSDAALVEESKPLVNDGKQTSRYEIEEKENLLNYFKIYFRFLKRREISFKLFYKVLKKDEGLTNQDHSTIDFPQSFEILALELFQKFDANNDTLLTPDEFVKKDAQEKKDINQYLEYQIARIEDYVEDLVEAKHHDEPLHLFEARMIERFRSQKKYDEL